MIDRPIKHLTQIELSRRWRVSHRTLERWRWEGVGPRYLKVGCRVVYRLEDVEAYETARVRMPQAEVYPGRSAPDRGLRRQVDEPRSRLRELA